MDAAKVMRLLYEHPECAIEDLTVRFMDIVSFLFWSILLLEEKNHDISAERHQSINSCLSPHNKVALLYVVTASGTGAEITPFAVLNGDDGHKYPICSYHLTPEMAIIDPIYATAMPRALTANTGYDAMVHSIESYVSVVASDYTRALSLQALKMIYHNLPQAYEDPTNEPVRERMHNGSAIGMLINNLTDSFWYSGNGLCECIPGNLSFDGASTRRFVSYSSWSG